VRADDIASRWRALRDEVGDTYALALFRMALGLLLLNEAWLATQQLRRGFFGDYFHQPAIPEALIVSASTYQIVVYAQWAAAALIVSGRWARPALVVASALLVYTMLCDRLAFHNYKHTMATFALLLAFAPCDRHLVLGRPPIADAAPLWVQRLIQLQVSIMYVASSGSKALDAEWRSGTMMREMIIVFSRLLERRGVPHDWIVAMQTPLAASLIAKGAIATEMLLAVALWSPRLRRVALWVGLMFHLSISLMTPVQLFTAMMLASYVCFATPDSRARGLRFDPKRATGLANIIDGLDWLRRFRLEKAKGSAFIVVARDGRELTGLGAARELFGAVPALFPFWPLVALAAIVAARTRGRAIGA
jgi:hypothetical protein